MNKIFQFVGKIRNRVKLIDVDLLRMGLDRLIFRLDVKSKFRFRSKIVLSSHFGGLGDNLQLSSLPEEFWRQFGKRTYISARSNHRNQEIFDLVWETNPFVFGISNKRPIAGDLPAWRSLRSSKERNLVSHWESTHGLNVKNELPQIYYIPNVINGWRNTVIIDLSSITLFPSPGANVVNAYDPQQLKIAVTQQLKSYPDCNFVSVVFTRNLVENKSSTNKPNVPIPDYEITEVQISSIYQYVDLIASCKAILTIYSGSAVLASAVKKYNKNLEVVTFITNQNYIHEINNVNYLFANVNYIKF